jgi:hypothetical protein
MKQVDNIYDRTSFIVYIYIYTFLRFLIPKTVLTSATVLNSSMAPIGAITALMTP